MFLRIFTQFLNLAIYSIVAARVGLGFGWAHQRAIQESNLWP